MNSITLLDSDQFKHVDTLMKTRGTVTPKQRFSEIISIVKYHRISTEIYNIIEIDWLQEATTRPVRVSFSIVILNKVHTILQNK